LESRLGAARTAAIEPAIEEVLIQIGAVKMDG